MDSRITGLVAATFTPMHADGSLNLAQVAPLVDRLLQEGISALYVCGSTGEGPSLSTEERQQTAAAYVEAAAGRLPVVVQVGHCSLADACRLAAHAAQIGADAISSVPPWYFRPGSVEVVVDCLAQIAAAAPGLPFYYYHIPSLTGVAPDMVEFLRQAGPRLPTLVGVKYTAPTVDEFQAQSSRIRSVRVTTDSSDLWGSRTQSSLGSPSRSFSLGLSSLKSRKMPIGFTPARFRAGTASSRKAAKPSSLSAVANVYFRSS